jgi:hypothetical protein
MFFSFLARKNTFRTVIKKPDDFEGMDAFIAEVTIPEKPILVKRRSALTGKLNGMVLPISMADLTRWLYDDQPQPKDSFPHLTAAQRLFMASGITPLETARLAAASLTKTKAVKGGNSAGS